MRFLKYIELKNYRNLKHAKLKDLKDLNIIIGPNNCGKTSVLKSIEMLGGLNFGRHNPPLTCPTCKNCFEKDNSILSIDGSVGNRDKYLTKTKVSAMFGYYKSEIEKVLPEFSGRADRILGSAVGHMRNDQSVRNHLEDEFSKERLAIKEHSNLKIIVEHISPVIWNEVKTKIFSILSCPEARLQNYKGEDFTKFIGSKDFETEEQARFISFLKETVDPNIVTMKHSLALVKAFGKDRFKTPIAEQGSGVKSLVCLVADILSEGHARILLIDEPELGLNPSSKHAFLKFLLQESKDKQIFLATHDPTFVNPILWNRENVSVYLFSIIENDFVKINLVQSKQDPNTFAGFLPHTTSLKQIHIYVEGTDDVYIFQILLNRYTRKHFDKWYQIVNKVGIYHLAGDFWKHLLYTIPRRPYTSIVVLDDDKREKARQVVDKYGTIERNRFQMFDSLEELRNEKRRKKPVISMPCPIYCLKRSEIEDYLEPRPPSKDEGPTIAHKMSYVPSEIEQLFDEIFHMANIRKTRKGGTPK